MIRLSGGAPTDSGTRGARTFFGVLADAAAKLGSPERLGRCNPAFQRSARIRWRTRNHPLHPGKTLDTTFRLAIDSMTTSRAVERFGCSCEPNRRDHPPLPSEPKGD